MASRVEELLTEMSLAEKCSLTSGSGMWYGNAVGRLGIPAVKVSDGPVGVRGQTWTGTTSACAPCGTALGATWNPALVEKVGVVIGEEARDKAVDIVLAPTVNLHRNALAGRNFECFSEDPHLTAVAAAAYISGVESTGVGACIKHFVANDSEYQRHTISSDVGERVLRELYLLPFEHVITGVGVTAVMSGYNRLNGTYCAENRWLLTEVLRDQWGFDGIVISDWWGTMSSASASAGLDLEMPGPPVHMGSTLVDRVERGEVSKADVDSMVTRLLSTFERLGILDLEERPAEKSIDDPHRSALLRRAAQEAVVLLKNDPIDGRPVLPLNVTTLREVAVIGPNADISAALGGGSAAVNPHHVTTVLEGLRDALGDSVKVTHEIGTTAYRTTPPLDRRRVRHGSGVEADRSGMIVEYFDNRDLSGEPKFVDHVDSPRLSWMGGEAAPGVPVDNMSLRLSGVFRADIEGPHTFALVTGGTGGRVLIDDEVVLDNYIDQAPGTSFFGLGSAEIHTTVDFKAGQEHKIACEFTGYEGLSVAALLLGHLPPVPADGIERAAKAASEADVAVVVVGLNQDSETEGEDRESIALPGLQDELIRAVTAANPATVVLVNAGSAVDLSAAGEAAAIAQTWYLGQEAGHAVADILTGKVSPSGRLPTTLGHREQDWPSFPNYPGSSGRVLYGEELFMGYRGFDHSKIEPAYCFGHGLGYSRFDWSDFSLSIESVGIEELRSGASVLVEATVTNSGPMTASDVVQCYVHDRASTVLRPEQELRSFQKVELAPGENARVSLALSFRSFAYWDPELSDWAVEPGVFDIRISRSSRDVVTSLDLTVLG